MNITPNNNNLYFLDLRTLTKQFKLTGGEVLLFPTKVSDIYHSVYIK